MSPSSLQKVVVTAAGAILSAAILASASAHISQGNRVSVLETHKAEMKESIAEIKASVRRIERYLMPPPRSNE